MSSLSPKIVFHPGWSADPLRRRIALARLALALERLLPGLWPAAGYIGAYFALALLGAFAVLPWPVQALLLAGAITAAGLSLAENFAGFTWPGTLEGARRLERDSGLPHRPISERDDTLAGGLGDALAEGLWKLHQARSLPAGGLRVAPPRADLASRDPYGLRWYLAILLAAALVVARGHVRDRLIGAFDSGAGAMARIDAWIDPPPYTGAPLQSLTAEDKGVIAVPAGSVLRLRVHGAPRAPGLTAGGNRAPRFAGAEGEYASNAVIAQDARVEVRVAGHTIGDWRLHAVPDAPPSVAFAAAPERTQRDAVKFAFRARDDYGVASVKVILTPHGRHGPPLSADLSLAPAKSVSQTSFVDLTAHPYAGLVVDAKLQARDAKGQVGTSRSISFRLPARVFTDPLARALIEQRQNLATADAAGRRRVAAALDALAIAPERFYEGKDAAYLALRSAYWGVRTARYPAQIARVEDLLWQTAMALEHGGLLTAAQELRKLQAQLTAALTGGAPQQVIDELLKRYDQAMQRYLEALMAHPQPQGKAAPDAKQLGMGDLDALLKAIQQLNAAGDRQNAAKMLALLQSMLENLRVTQGGQGQGGQGQAGNKALNDAMRKFGDLMGQQRMLLDKTFRQGHGQGNPKDGGAQGLARQQGALQNQLNQALKGLDPKLADKLRQAGQAMGEAKGALGQQDFDNAGNAQKNALEALRQGAGELAKEALKQGKNGPGQGQDDPLGRSISPFGNSRVKIPGPSDLARARQILQELRKRAGELGRPQQERDYIDRLLKEF
jgi:uncharacterized protein (TIGR02302 family)